jgi:DNA repair exonuclease SbcCD ATPase subunit
MAGIKIKFDTNDVERQIKNIIKDATEQLKNPIEGKIEFKSDDLAKLTEQIGKLGEAFNKIDFSKLNQLGESTKQGKAVIDGVSDSLSKVNVKLNDSSDNIKQFQKSIESLLQSGDKLKNITQVLNPDTKELQGFNVAIEKTNGQIQKMKYYLQDASKEGASFSRIDLKIVDGQQIKQLEQMLNMLNKIEDKFSNIKLTPHGDSLKELDNLKKQLNEQLNSFTNGNDINIDFSKVKQQISSLGDELSKVQKQDLTTIDKKENLYNKVLDIQKKLFQNQIDQTKAGETRLRQLQQEEKIIKSSLEANSKLYFDQFGKKQLNNELTSNQKKQDSKLNTISTNNIDNERQQQLNDLVRESEQEYSKLNNLLNQEYELKNKLINKEGEERKALEDSLKIIQSKRDAQLEYINAEGLSNKYSTQSYLGNVSNKQFTLDTNTNQYNGKVEDDISKYKAKMLNALDEVERAYKSKNGDLKFKINGIDETKGKIEDLILSMNKVNCEQVKQKVTSAMKEIRSQINETDSATNKWGSSLTKAIGNTLKYGIAYNAMYSAMSAFTDQIREGLSFMVDLDTAQSNIIMITGKTREEVQGLTKDYANLAGQLHDTTLNTMQEGEEFLRAG